MRAQSAAAVGPARPWVTLLAGGAVGLAIFLLTLVLSDIQLALGPWALNGNGALAVPFLGFPVALYAGWTMLGDRHAGRDLALQVVALSLGLIVGAGLLGLFLGLPMALLTGAIYALLVRGLRGSRRDAVLWVAFAASVLIGSLPVVGLFGVGLLPASLILLARPKRAAARVGLGALLVVATTLIVFGIPLLFPAPAPAL
ncbi:MAG: hypothetical protein ACYC9W_09915 [Candidatus Limnocylindria bacterium]